MLDKSQRDTERTGVPRGRSLVMRGLPVRIRSRAPNFEAEHRLDLITGGVISCWSLDAPDTVRGGAYARIIVDEAAMVPHLDRVWQLVLRFHRQCHRTQRVNALQAWQRLNKGCPSRLLGQLEHLHGQTLQASCRFRERPEIRLEYLLRPARAQSVGCVATPDADWSKHERRGSSGLAAGIC